jgi:hypothetical protein
MTIDRSTAQVANSMAPGRAPWIRGAVLGLVVGSLLLFVQVQAVGGWAGLLQVGEDAAVRTFIEERLGEIPLAPGIGHDGQTSFAIGSDLLGAEVPELLDHPGYRYRRILYPAAGSLFGLLEGQALLAGLVAVAIGGFALSTAAVSWIAAARTLPRWVILGVVANPGAWLGMWMLTVDALAMGMALAGIAAALGRRRLIAVALVTGAVLAKDQYLLIPLSLVLLTWRDDRRFAVVLGLGPLALP